MNKMPQIPEARRNIRMTTTFSGYNHREVINDGEMYDTINLSDDMYPVLCNRKRRGITEFDTEDPLSGIHGRDKLVYIRGNKIYYDGKEVLDITVSTDSLMMPKQIVSMGAYVAIWPDKVYFNTEKTDYQGRPYGEPIERIFQVSPAALTIQMCKMDGTDITVPSGNIRSKAPKTPTNGMLWIDTSGDTHVLREYTSATKEWVEIATVYVKITESIGEFVPNTFVPRLTDSLKEYDTIEISGLVAADTESDTAKAQVEALNGPHIIYGIGEVNPGQSYGQYYIIVEGMLDQANPVLDSTEVAHFDLKVPDLDFIVESNNRLWGCRYGMENGETINEIKACKLGDMRNWNNYMGLSTDSYTMSIGTEGPWTGAIVQRGYPIFFKENSIQKITGNTPSSYQLNTIKCKGVQKGSWRSLARLNETVFYKADNEVMAYDGNMPFIISDNLGDVLYSDARAGAQGNKYYISMKNHNNEWNFFVYDTRNNIWYREDDLHALGFGAVGSELYAIDEAHNTLITINGSAGEAEDELEWKAEFGLSGVEYTNGRYGMAREDMNGSHYLSRFDIRMYLEEEGRAELEIMYDSSGEWTKQGVIRGNRMKTFVLPVVPRRCDHLRFRLKGKGDFRIYSISRVMEVGSDG